MAGADTITQARTRAGISKRELSRRAHTSPAAIVEYESGRRSPTVDTLARLIDACGLGYNITLYSTVARERRNMAGKRLSEVLALADSLPHRAASRKCGFPGFRQLTKFHQVLP
ncbi:MAG: helix-turn-helix transcriptional regulator [Actinobacteria bacterium]|nr:helix-turn-helix transcriptional regulator [Actinomycetota bacterium]